MSDELAESILQLSDIMRYSMQDGINRVRLDEEVDYVRRYIDLNRARNPDELFIDFTVEGPIDQKEIPPFLLIGLVENAFKHGKLNEADYPLHLHIQATDTSIRLFASNKKNHKKNVESNRIGLANLHRRLELTYPQRFTFDVRQTDDDFSCELIIQT